MKPFLAVVAVAATLMGTGAALAFHPGFPQLPPNPSAEEIERDQFLHVQLEVYPGSPRTKAHSRPQATQSTRQGVSPPFFQHDGTRRY